MIPAGALDVETLRAQGGDRAATDAVLRRMQPPMLRLVAEYVARTQALGSLEADLESAGWRGLLLGIESYRQGAGKDAAGWLLLRARNAMREVIKSPPQIGGIAGHRRRRQARGQARLMVEDVDAAGGLADGSAGVDQRLEADEVEAIMAWAVVGMNPGDSEIARMYLEGMEVEGLRRRCAAPRSHVEAVIRWVRQWVTFRARNAGWIEEDAR